MGAPEWSTTRVSILLYSALPTTFVEATLQILVFRPHVSQHNMSGLIPLPVRCVSVHNLENVLNLHHADMPYSGGTSNSISSSGAPTRAFRRPLLVVEDSTDSDTSPHHRGKKPERVCFILCVLQRFLHLHSNHRMIM